MRIREGGVADVKALVRVSCACGHPCVSRTFRFLLALDEEESDEKEAVMGVAAFYPLLCESGGFHCYLDNIVVSKKHRRKGVGSALMDAVREEARRFGAQQLHFGVSYTWIVYTGDHLLCLGHARQRCRCDAVPPAHATVPI